MNITMRLSGIILFALLAAFPVTARADQNVELELLLAIDTSTSINQREFHLQREGFARAFESDEVRSAIASLGEAGMVVSIVQWAGPKQQYRAVDWHKVSGTNGHDELATKIRGMKRQVDGFTDIAGALEFSLRELMSNDWRGARLAIDVSGDGTSDNSDPARYRDLAVAQGVTINGLVIYSEEYDLGGLARIALRQHYLSSVIGGAGAFLIEAENFEAFEEAIRRKLLREISGSLYTQNTNPVPFNKIAVRNVD